MQSHKSTSVEQTREIGEQIARNLPRPCLVFLTGDLGAGKTSLTQGIIKGLGSAEIAKSPTYTIERTYTKKDGSHIHHFDFYRLAEDDHLMKETLSEYVHQAEGDIIIEWPSALTGIDQHNYTQITLKITGADEREITVSHS